MPRPTFRTAMFSDIRIFTRRCCLLGLLSSALASTAGWSAEPEPKQDEAPISKAQQTALDEVERRTQEIGQVNRALWDFAEVGLEERKSAALLVEKLRSAGFTVESGVSGMPTAFIASYGSGKPIIGVLAEYDALPDLSQEASPQRAPKVEGGAGHGCGHCALGAGALGAALAVKQAMEQHKLPGTIRLYGTPAEETLIGKVYMVLDGRFKDLDACLHWHPASQNEVWAGSSKAAVSAKFTFHGVASHASGSPEKGRSALDAVELMNVGANYMREHIKSDARLHYVVIDGGGAPNVVPAQATVWYYVRADAHRDVETNFAWLQDVAQGAALMSRTKLTVKIDTDCHEIIPNNPLAQMLERRMASLPTPTHTEEEAAFARRIQTSIAELTPEATFPEPFASGLRRMSAAPPTSGGSTDVGDVSWQTPTCGVRAVCFAAESPGHSWQNVAAVGGTVGDKGAVYAAKVLSCGCLDLFENPELLKAAREDWTQRMKGRTYTSLIPEGQPPPAKIR